MGVQKARREDLSPCEGLVYGASWLWLGEALAPAGTDAVAVAGGRVVAVGPARELRQAWKPLREWNLQGAGLAPGFVDAHAHPAFAAGRAAEFEQKCQGRSYQEIAAAGGGIQASVRAVRAVSEAELTAAVGRNFRRMLRHGTTTCEAKSGYGLSLAEESKQLRAIAAAGREVGMEVTPTFLGAHAVPEEFRGRADAYVDVLCEEALPAIRAAGLARAADVFIEEGAFDLAQARRYLERARELGFALRVHADQFRSLGGVELAVELGAECVDHLEALTDAGLEALALSRRTWAGLLPVAPHFLGLRQDAPARKLLRAGVPCFVATDFNPGSAYGPSLVEAAHFARRRLGLTAEEALRCVTAAAADSLGLGARKGRIAVGADADLVALDLAGVEEFGYAVGENPVTWVMKGGHPTDTGPDGCGSPRASDRSAP